MKIGFSYSRCVRDIVDGAVDIDDVLIIISRTDFDPNDDGQWTSIWKGYGGGSNGNELRGMLSGSLPEWSKYGDDMEQRFREISVRLWEEGKLHQPRKFGAHPRRSSYIWVDTGPIGHEQYQQPEAVQQAWQNYLVLNALTHNREKQYG
jgi:hypothetical protein